MRKGIIIFIVAVGAVILVGQSYSTWQHLKSGEPIIIGGQKDAHGCLIPAGYSWCDARAECIRPWETYCTATEPKVALFNCDGGTTITASFYPGDDKYVDLVLGDGRALSVPPRDVGLRRALRQCGRDVRVLE